MSKRVCNFELYTANGFKCRQGLQDPGTAEWPFAISCIVPECSLLTPAARSLCAPDAGPGIGEGPNLPSKSQSQCQPQKRHRAMWFPAAPAAGQATAQEAASDHPTWHILPEIFTR